MGRLKRTDDFVEPFERIILCNKYSLNPDGDYVLYWMNAYRRPSWNFSLDRAIELSKKLNKPLLVVETLSLSEKWSSDRHHVFVIEGMANNVQCFKDAKIQYYPFMETIAGSARELVIALAQSACVVVTDDFPMRNSREEVDAVVKSLTVRLEKVDSNGLLPMRATSRIYPSAYTFRRFLQKVLVDHILVMPSSKPFARCKMPHLPTIPREIRKRWPAVSNKLLNGNWSELAKLSIDHTVPPSNIPGGWQAARRKLRHFIKHNLANYQEDRNKPEIDATSGMSPYLHFGHISAHEIFYEVVKLLKWSPDNLSMKVTGKSLGWWGMPESVESFLDELITWRELGFNMCVNRKNYDRFNSLPNWAIISLAKHAKDPRSYKYSVAVFEQAQTHDVLWNSAQTQLVGEGRMHNYLRMLWGKKILEWSANPRTALDIMIELNNKYALDGQDPNSYCGIFWTLGRYDRPWGPERNIFGSIRYMSSENTRRKFSVDQYIRCYS